MSEYQLYEFLAVDRPLEDGEIAELRSVSSRARITPTSFVVEYSYSDLKADPLELLTRYFDIHLYLANWGTRRLLLKLPADLVDLERLRSFCDEEIVTAREHDDFVLLEICLESEEGDEWVEADPSRMASIAAVREEILCGDLRPLYLGWLAGVNERFFEPEDLLPPVPPGLRELSKAQRALADLLGIDDALVQAAAEASVSLPSEPAGLREWIRDLPVEQKEAWLLEVALRQSAQVGRMMVRQFRTERRDDDLPASSRPRRSVEDLLAGTAVIRAALEAEEARRREKERRRRERAAAKAREKRLAELDGKEREAWMRVEELVALMRAEPYDQAVAILQDLQELARRRDDADRFAKLLARFRERHATKQALIRRLKPMQRARENDATAP